MLELLLNMVDTPEDRSKLEQIYYKYRKLMKYTALKILHNEDMAEDAVSDALVSLAENIDRIDDVDSNRTKAFIYTVTRRASLNIYNKAKRQAAENIDDYIDISADTDIFDNLYLDDLYKQIMSFPSLYRDILLFKVFYGLTNKEAARLLGTSESVIRKRLERARKLLSELIEKEKENV